MPHTDPRTDEALIDAINAGDERAFDVLYYRYRDWVYRLAYRFVHNEADALDILQETFIYLAGKFPGFRLMAALTTLLYRAARSRAVTLGRRNRPAELTDAMIASTAARGQAVRQRRQPAWATCRRADGPSLCCCEGSECVILDDGLGEGHGKGGNRPERRPKGQARRPGGRRVARLALPFGIGTKAINAPLRSPGFGSDRQRVPAGA